MQLLPVSKGATRRRARAVCPCWRASARRAADQAGQTLAEMGLILTVIAAVVIVSAAVLFRDGITSAFGSATSCIQAVCASGPDAGEGGNNHCNDGNGEDGSQPGC